MASLLLVLQAKSAVSAAERDRKQLDKQLQDFSQAIEAATAALQDLQRQIRAAEVGCCCVDARIPCHTSHATAGVARARCTCMACVLTPPLCRMLQAELATDMNAGLSAAERRQLGELQPQIEGLEQQLKDAKKAAVQVGRPPSQQQPGRVVLHACGDAGAPGRHGASLKEFYCWRRCQSTMTRVCRPLVCCSSRSCPAGCAGCTAAVIRPRVR